MGMSEDASWDDFPPGGLHASSDIRKVMNTEKPEGVRELIARARCAIHNQRTAYENTRFLEMCEARLDDIEKALATREEAISHIMQLYAEQITKLQQKRE